VINLDTHMLVFALADRLTARERRVVALGKTWSISAIVLWELAKLVQLGRLDLDLDHAETVRALSRLHVWPIDLPISLMSTRLDFVADPADELIAATSVVHQVPLLTRDRRMRRSAMVPLA
jgi:PIN domain nuclease of toxin-antitoxin system